MLLVLNVHDYAFWTVVHLVEDKTNGLMINIFVRVGVLTS